MASPGFGQIHTLYVFPRLTRAGAVHTAHHAANSAVIRPVLGLNLSSLTFNNLSLVAPALTLTIYGVIFFMFVYPQPLPLIFCCQPGVVRKVSTGAILHGQLLLATSLLGWAEW